MKPILILCLFCVVYTTSCKKSSQIPPDNTENQKHVDSLNKILSHSTWYFNDLIIKTGGGTELETRNLLNAYNFTFDGKSTVTAQMFYIPHTTVIATYKLSYVNGGYFINFYDASNSPTGKATVIFKDYDAANIEYAQQFSLYIDKGPFSPEISDPQQLYTYLPKYIEYSRAN